MKLGIFDKNNLKGFSGIPKNLISSLQEIPELELEIFYYQKQYRPRLVKRIQKRLAWELTGKYYLWEKEPRCCKHISLELDRFISLHNPDAVLMFGSEGCAYSTSKVPIFTYSDSIFGSRCDFYDDQKSMSALSIRQGRLVQQLALDRISKMFISSRWAVEKAIEHYSYRVDSTKFHIVGVGANLPQPTLDILAYENAFKEDRFDFLWIGVDWERKRGAFAIEVIRAMRENGLDARLHIIGATDYTGNANWVVQHGRLDYAVPAQRELLANLYQQSKGLILPSIADLTPCVIAEAYAHARPVFVSNVGGIPEMLTDPLHGVVIREETAEQWANSIINFYPKHRQSPAGRIATSCQQAFLNRFNWASIARTISDAIRADIISN